MIALTASQNDMAESNVLAEEALALEALLVARTHLYTLFHKCFGGTPDEELLDALCGEATRSVVEEYADDNASMAGLLGFLESLAEKDGAALLDQAKDEYVRIFVGPANLPASPYESPYTGAHDMSLFQENTLAVRRAFREQGLQVKRLQRVPDDHVSLMCHFLSLLGGRALDALQVGDAALLAACLRTQSRFVDEHMANWLDTYAQAVRNSKPGATAVLYPQLLEALAAFVQADAVFLREAAYWAEQAGDALVATPPRFQAARDAISDLRAIHLLGLEENELEDVEALSEA